VLHAATSNDVDAQAALLRGWNQSYAQLSAGRFEGSLVETKLDGVSLFIESTSQTLLQGGCLPNDVFAVGIPLQMGTGGVFCGTRDRESAVHVFSGSNGFEFLSPAGLVMSGIVVARQALLDVLAAEERPLIVSRLDRAHLTDAGNAPGAMREFVMAVLDLAGTAPHLVGNATLRQSLQHSIVSNLAQLLLSCVRRGNPTVRLGRRWKLVSMAREVVLSNPAAPTSIADLCRTLGVSRRTLQYCFQDVVGRGPLEFLRAIRLNAVRRSLRTAPSVTDAAAHWGFWHLGHFSRDYRAMFGELPSQTARRYRRFEEPVPRTPAGTPPLNT
jgi:AraC family ethanolamine operon transcriptional activator